MIELKPCPIPWCGSPAESKDIHHYQSVETLVRCTDVVCELHGSWTDIEAWNRRSPSPAVKALVKAVRESWESGCDKYLPLEDALAAVEKEIGA